MRMYRSLARGPCVEEYAARLERECDSIWKQGRQSCECISLTGKACRLKVKKKKKKKKKRNHFKRIFNQTNSVRRLTTRMKRHLQSKAEIW
jgi:hypothetical protein